MNIRKITEDILYTGVNDRICDRFEGLWPLPYGVSYNSYLVKGEKIALIDSVDAAYVADLIDNVKSSTDNAKIDYIVVNHMEPDHSGGIPMLIEHFPEMKIVGNKQTIGMIKGFYHLNDDSLYHEVADGTSLDLGGKTLRFILTPMVHWPETMMTYVEEDNVLFSGDAFGCFGALNGGVVDSDMDCSIYFEEMYRYYSNIVGKYGRFVQKVLEKTAGLKLDYICTTHGPVWHSEIAKVVDIYNRLSSYQSEPGATIIYGSMYGNTAEVAERIAQQLSMAGIKKIRVHNASKSSLSDMISDAFRYEILIVGGPTYSLGLFPPVAQFLDAMSTREIKNKVFASFGAHTWSPLVSKKIAEFGEKLSLNVVGSLEMKQSPCEQTNQQISRLVQNVLAATHSAK